MNDMETARKRIAEARRILVLTGAGVSAESGVPTFRGADGLWKKVDPMALATPDAFERDPTMVWEWYDWRRSQIALCQPNPAHHAIARLEEQKREGFLLVTQNVDGLHGVAGSREMIELHGSIWRVRSTEGRIREWEDRRVPIDPIPPRDDQGALVRPAVVWFGEYLPPERIRRIDSFISGGVDVLLVAGTSALIGYIQMWVLTMKQSGTFIVEVNGEESTISELSNIVLLGRAGEILPQLVSEGGG